jgi:tetratricopeptide (TPR) repeat protein
LIRREPDEVAHRKRLASSYNNLGLLYDRTRQHDKAKAAIQQSLALHESVHSDHPKVVEFTVDLAGSYGNLATHLRRTGAAEESLEWTAKAIRMAEPVLKQDPRYAPARMLLFDSLMGRGYAYVRLNRRDEAVKDWRRMLEISQAQLDIRMRLYRPFACVFLGEHAQATAEIEALLAEGQTQANNLLMFAEVHALSAAAAVKDARLSPAERDGLADQYGGRAVRLLRQARDAGYFQGSDAPGQLKNNKDLDAIRARPDFAELVAEVEKQANSKP